MIGATGQFAGFSVVAGSPARDPALSYVTGDAGSSARDPAETGENNLFYPALFFKISAFIFGCMIKLLLTSSGVTNESMRDALAELLGKPISEAEALFVPTGVYPYVGGANYARWPVAGKMQSNLVGLAGTHRAAKHQQGCLAAFHSKRRCAAGLGRRSVIPGLLV